MRWFQDPSSSTGSSIMTGNRLMGTQSRKDHVEPPHHKISQEKSYATICHTMTWRDTQHESCDPVGRPSASSRGVSLPWCATDGGKSLPGQGESQEPQVMFFLLLRLTWLSPDLGSPSVTDSLLGSFTSASKTSDRVPDNDFNGPKVPHQRWD